MGVGSKEEIQQRLDSILGESSQPTPSTTDKLAQSRPEKTSQEKGTSYCKHCPIYKAVIHMYMYMYIMHA